MWYQEAFHASQLIQAVSDKIIVLHKMKMILVFGQVFVKAMMARLAIQIKVAYLGIVLRVVTFVLPLTVHLAPISPVRHGCPVRAWQLGVLVTLATRHVCKVHKALVPVTTNAALVIAITQLVNWTQEYAQSQVFALH